VLAEDGNMVTALAGFRTASAELPDRWLLQRRIDRKFVFSSALLEPLLSALAPHFSVLRAGIAPIATYQTVYFDTAGRQLYEDHRRGRLPRHKVRLRHHLERRLSFLEVKRKTADGRTTKARLERPFGDQPSVKAASTPSSAARCPVCSRSPARLETGSAWPAVRA
jgi:hypothetical protein